MTTATITINIEPGRLGTGRIQVDANIENHTDLDRARIIVLGLCVLGQLGVKTTTTGTLGNAVFRRIGALVEDPELLDH